jgi:Domain of unknown function (DUF5979)
MAAIKGHGPRRGVVQLLSVLVLLAAVVGAAGPAGAAKKTPPGDPPGNNGTVKIERDGPNDEDRGNEPIGDGCLIWLEFYGYDQGQTADITFTSHAPTEEKQLLVDNGVAISGDPAGGGQDRDAVIGYNLTSALQGLTPQKNHGFHIKMTANTREAPGGAKQKVFWLNCTPAAPTTLDVTKAVEGPGSGPFSFEVRCNHRPITGAFTLNAGETFHVHDIPPGTTCVTTETDAKGAKQTRIAEQPADGQADGQMKLAAGQAGALTFTNVFPPSSAPAGTPQGGDTGNRNPSGEPAGSGGNGSASGTTGGTGTGNPGAGNPTVGNAGAHVLGTTEARPAATTTLPRTGGDPRPLTATGLWALAAGGVALAAGRRPGRRGRRA